jgi:hypothetical protein
MAFASERFIGISCDVILWFKAIGLNIMAENNITGDAC